MTGRTLPFWSDSSDSLHMNAATALADAPLLAFTGPDSASVVAAGSPFAVSWSLADSAGVDSVSLSLSTDAGRTFGFQATYPWGGTAPGLGATVGGGSAWWTPPLVAADSCMLALDARNRLGRRTRRLTRGTFALQLPLAAGDPAGREAQPVRLVVPAVATARGVDCRVAGARPDADVRFDLLRADGRLVAHGVGRGESPWQWSGRDDAGAPVGSGVFWVRAHIDGARILTTRFVYLTR